jgi:hypothetical protein
MKILLGTFATVAALVLGQASALAQVCSFDPADISASDDWIYNNKGGVCPGGAGFGFDCDPADPRISIWFAPDWCGRYSTCPVGNRSFADGISGAWHTDLNEWGLDGLFVEYTPGTAFAKLLNSAYLLYFGLEDSETQSWHGTQEYIALADASDNVYHSDYFRQPVNDDNFLGRWSRAFIAGDDQFELMCTIFDTSKYGYANPSARLATTMHEAWHAWENKNVHAGGIGHKPDQGNCTASGDADGEEGCDYFYPHTINVFRPFGTLYQANINQAIDWLPVAYSANIINPNKFHSPNQIAYEFLCDLITNHAPWVTVDIVTDAQNSAREIAMDRFINMPPMDCGNGRPMP